MAPEGGGYTLYAIAAVAIGKYTLEHIQYIRGPLCRMWGRLPNAITHTHTITCFISRYVYVCAARVCSCVRLGALCESGCVYQLKSQGIDMAHTGFHTSVHARTNAHTHAHTHSTKCDRKHVSIYQRAGSIFSETRTRPGWGFCTFTSGLTRMTNGK